MNKINSSLKKVSAVLLTLTLIFSFVAINDIKAYAATTKVSKIEVTNLKNKTLTLNKGNKKTLNVKVTVSGKKISKDFTVKTSNKKVATVKKSGKQVIITAKKDGNANITITSKANKKKKLVVKVKVVTPVKNITLNTTNTTIYTGKTLQLKATVSSDATNKNITWASSNTSVATVSSTGLVTAKKAGTTTISAKAQDGSGKYATCVVKVATPNSIASVNIVNETIVEVTLSSPQKLSKSNFVIDKKVIDWGNYVSNCEIDYVETSDNKKYTIYLNDYIELQDYVRVTVSGLMGVNGKAFKEKSYTSTSNTITSEAIYKVTCNNSYSQSFYPNSDMVGYCTINNTELPPGLNIEYGGYGNNFYIKGTATKSGIYKTTVRFTDEFGKVEIREVTFVVGDVNKVFASAKPAYYYTNANGKYSLSSKNVSDIVYATGGSGSYKYEIVGDAYGLSINSSGKISGTISKAGTYNINVKVTDANNSTYTTNAVWTVNLKQGMTIEGTVKDAEGNGIYGVKVYFENENDKYIEWASVTTNSLGKYEVTVPAGTYDVLISYNNVQKYVGRKSVSENQTGWDMVLPVYKVEIKSDKEEIASFATWYDSNGKEMGSGNYLYLRAGTYSLESEGTNFLTGYTAVLNITVSKSTEVTAKVTTKRLDTPTITLGQTISTILTGEYIYYKFVPTETGTYYFYSSSSNDTDGAIYSETGSRIKYDDQSGVGSNFEISYKFTAGTTYYLAAKYYFSGTISASVTVSTTTSN